ncbi:hypothetical protein DM01DRAFT_202065 [Hesseltinella vesiculosa]|uniref:Uncharacterized protein n=1 Tax=Hesseltinella vesiculosa TaxID=101127 RepID=A0A1X2GXQ1_9FUNG|nr:hypothetical protein DM01DRAFT_202065 [Hesseltinella vesiculosa]
MGKGKPGHKNFRCDWQAVASMMQQSPGVVFRLYCEAYHAEQRRWTGTHDLILIKHMEAGQPNVDLLKATLSKRSSLDIQRRISLLSHHRLGNAIDYCGTDGDIANEDWLDEPLGLVDRPGSRIASVDQIEEESTPSPSPRIKSQHSAASPSSRRTATEASSSPNPGSASSPVRRKSPPKQTKLTQFFKKSQKDPVSVDDLADSLAKTSIASSSKKTRTKNLQSETDQQAPSRSAPENEIGNDEPVPDTDKQSRQLPAMDILLANVK